jgi:hypothetical protein
VNISARVLNDTPDRCVERPFGQLMRHPETVPLVGVTGNWWELRGWLGVSQEWCWPEGPQTAFD